jgi:hypothetical protein
MVQKTWAQICSWKGANIMAKGKEEGTGIYGCYRCGAVGGEIRGITNDNGPLRVGCGECGEENTIVTFQVALDLLNENHFHDRLRGGLCYEKSVDDLDEFLGELKDGE